jgi:multicomponent Na+:H+ antiporter subunit D
MLLIPPVLTALLALLAGLLADAPFSPLSWATRIAEGEYLR